MDKYRILVKGIVQYENKYLLTEKWYDDRIMDPYQWEFLDGELEFGESPEKGVLRIVYENTGVNAHINRILYTWSFMLGDVCNIGICFHLLSTSEEVVLSEELHDYQWVSKEDIETYVKNKAVLEDVAKAEL
ncbi:NUDIX domain-containing protein [Anaerocolumna sp. AGMB13020]|jgi:NADH pyrophosphatase NudC (nudix superfamily)|uniref:NUDIX domain-containing protein n=1 Tax=Anaerocolumna sp. AGMB13020 TaxID=3081750 RepID=UPI002955751E|nr:NUDIX domain-containing protein [Anaerocolumna sp. AGMB13020]WOO36095.1 NUDIX domain-containing protein [Anaerocolumna sp. AGMB13020]